MFHVSHFLKNSDNLLTIPWDKGLFVLQSQPRLKVSEEIPEALVNVNGS